jgi:enamine deaminase RidA (YjgF/YER057c/UK114 family)
MKFNITIVKLCNIIIAFTIASSSHIFAQNVILKGNPKSIISSTAEIKAGSSLFFTSGFTAAAIDPTLEDGNYEKYGNTETQAMSVLSIIKTYLEEEGLSMSDVFSMKVFVSPDSKTGQFDFVGWNNAYKKYFGTAENPSKPVRATVGVATLVSPYKFIEVEVIAARK